MLNNLKKIRLVSFLIFLFISSCRISSNDDLINYFANEINEYNNDYLIIVNVIDTIHTNNIQYRIHRWPNQKKHLKLDEYYMQDSTFVDDFVFPETLHGFMLDRKITNLIVKVKKEICFTYLHKRNHDFNDVYLMYFFKGFDANKEEYKKNGYEIFSGLERPKNYSNWLYKINENWAVLSPKKEN
jgi:hypothetical protein